MRRTEGAGREDVGGQLLIKMDDMSVRFWSICLHTYVNASVCVCAS